MKVCIICIEYPPFESGVAIACRRIANSLKKKAEVHVLTFSGSDSYLANRARVVQSKNEDGVHVHTISPYHGNLTHVPPQEIQNICYFLSKLHKKHKFDLIHGFNLTGAGFSAAFMGKQLKIPSLVSVRGNDIGRDIFGTDKLFTIKWTIENASHVTYVANDLMEYSKTLTDQKNMSVIHNCLNPFEFFYKDIKLKLDGFVISFSGVVRRKKGFAYLADAFKKFRAKHKATLLIVGELMPEEKVSYLQLFEELGIAGNVMITGRVRHNIILNYINLSDAFVLPAISEGCSNSLLEAMYCGKPVIATKVGAAKEFITHNSDGLLVEPHSSESLYRAMMKLKKSKKLRTTLSKNAKNTILTKHSPEIEAKEWLKIYKKCVK